MADEEKVGTPWRDDGLDAIVADYSEMLNAELAGQRYVKLRHSEALMARTGRTHRSVEFKHQDISAVLSELDLPWIPGYRPKRNYQGALFPAIDRYLSSHPALFESLPTARQQTRLAGTISARRCRGRCNGGWVTFGCPGRTPR